MGQPNPWTTLLLFIRVFVHCGDATTDQHPGKIANVIFVFVEMLPLAVGSGKEQCIWMDGSISVYYDVVRHNVYTKVSYTVHVSTEYTQACKCKVCHCRKRSVGGVLICLLWPIDVKNRSNKN